MNPPQNTRKTQKLSFFIRDGADTSKLDSAWLEAGLSVPCFASYETMRRGADSPTSIRRIPRESLFFASFVCFVGNADSDSLPCIPCVPWVNATSRRSDEFTTEHTEDTETEHSIFRVFHVFRGQTGFRSSSVYSVCSVVNILGFNFPTLILFPLNPFPSGGVF